MKKYYIASGSGQSKYQLVAFDNALIQAGLSNYNLVRVSSILPAMATRRQYVDLELGIPLHTAYATVSSNTPGEKIATAIAVGIPKMAVTGRENCENRVPFREVKTVLFFSEPD